MSGANSYRRKYVKDFEATVVERKHIILLDGTWNDETGLQGDGLVTNIVRMHRIFKNDAQNQIVRYHRGVGNDNDNNWFQSNWKGATGKAIAKIVEKAFARFVKDWQVGDRVYIFGFSRGAAAARLLASKIAKQGIPKSVEIVLEPKENRETRVVEQVIADVKMDYSSSHSVDVEFLGVWDTVSALGLANNLTRLIGVKKDDLFADDTIAPNIKRAVHLVGIDETRNIFVPSLMNQKENESVIQEVWFPGVHSDLGGSYLEDEIAQLSLGYMIKEMMSWNEQQGLKPFVMDQDAKELYTKTEVTQAHFHFHGNAFGKDLREISVQVDGKKSGTLIPKIHRSYLDFVSSSACYSVFDKEVKGSGKQKMCINFQYMPFNVKVLDGEYTLVE